MKHLKKIAAALTAALLCCAMLSACGSSTGNGETADVQYTIGIGQFGPHGSLDNCREGFLEGLKEAGIEEGKNLTVDYQNANFDGGVSNQIAANFVSKKVNLICAIATPIAQAAYNAAFDTDIPVIFTAVTDPKAAELTEGNVTGTSDLLPVEAQLKMIRAMLPDAKKIGILYTTSETNSISTIALYKNLAPKYNFEIVDKGVSQASEIPQAMDAIVKKVDCISNLTDNTVVGALPTVLDKANAAKIPVFGSEIEQVKNGCMAAEGIEYFELGKQTGAMAAKVLKGEAKASEIPFEEISESFLYVNEDVMKSFGVTLPDSLKARAQAVKAEQE